jgi:hypothetical protein
MLRLVILASGVLAQLAAGPVLAATCAREDFAAAVDRAGADLRRLNADNTPRLQAKMRQLKDKKGWPDAGFEQRAYADLQDERIAAFDTQANDLLAKIDALGTFTPAAESDCAKLQELTATALELQATIKAKTTYTLAKLDQMLAGPPAAISEAPVAKAPEPRKAPPPAPAAKKAPESTWSTQTKGEPRRDVAVSQPPAAPPAPALPPHSSQALPEDEGYTIDEIKAASAGFFGKISAGLGSVIEHLFSSSGRPKGYILGTEGGGAFLAGVRYGKGTLYLRSGGTQKIYWHGPSLGTDLGADGSKTLFLIYRLGAPEHLFAAFTGIDGSAFFVGGVGATLMTNGDVVMAPIRSGVGLRVGANVGRRLYPLYAARDVESFLRYTGCGEPGSHADARHPAPDAGRFADRCAG